MSLKDNISRKQYESLLDKIESEGFDYALIDYSDWKNIKDAKFQELIRQFRKARNDLKKYIGIDDY